MSTREDLVPRFPRRLHRKPFYDILPGLVDKVRTYLVELVGPVVDNPQALDAEARALVPSSGPSAANCAAVWTKPNGTRVVAWNSVLLPRATEFYQGKHNWEYVSDGSCTKHAEIKLMDADQTIYMGEMFDCYIGISKPCCLPCAAVMKIEGIRTRGRHNDKNTNWEFPRIYYKDMGRMKEFLGDEVHDILVERNEKPTDEMPYVKSEIQELMLQLARLL